ncbi:MAG: diguanylate cyclase [Proteobacteria bacterium]|nr:diguanylate cyclase [Pseudomonadota bacterium]NOG59637.1 diguanylate cyclase [Pseudomonadota bacterium]
MTNKSGDETLYSKADVSVDDGCLIAILDAAVDAIIIIDEHGLIELFNQAAECIFQYSSDEIVGKNISMLMPEPYKSEHDSYLQRYKSTGKKKIIGIGREAVGLRKNGEIFPIELSVSETYVSGKVVYAGIVRDITVRKKTEAELLHHRDNLELLVQQRTNELSKANEELQKLANVDGLTQLSNRRNFDEMLQKELQRAIRFQHPISLMMCDIDYFKQYNDTYRHIAGDDCLVSIAKCLRESFKRASDVPARYGGEEFSVILPHTDHKEAKYMSERFVQEIRSLKIPHSSSDISEFVTVSLGIVSVVPDMPCDIKVLINVADEQLYKAKQNGRNRIEIVELKSVN